MFAKADTSRNRHLRSTVTCNAAVALANGVLQAVARWVLASGRGGPLVRFCGSSTDAESTGHRTRPHPGAPERAPPLGPRSCGLRSIRAIRSLVSQGLTNRKPVARDVTWREGKGRREKGASFPCRVVSTGVAIVKRSLEAATWRRGSRGKAARRGRHSAPLPHHHHLSLVRRARRAGGGQGATTQTALKTLLATTQLVLWFQC